MPSRARIGRAESLAAVPVKAPALKTEHKSGKVYVTVEFERPAWQRFLGAARRCRRTFGLDAYGQEVYGACDGKTPVRAMIDRFADGHRLSPPEAEMAVTTFLKTLIAKGLVGMAVERMPNAE